MKRSLAGMLVLLGGAVAVHAQGTVSLANYLSLSTYIYVGFKPTTGSPVLLGGGSTGPAPTMANWASETGNGNQWTVGLYGAAGWNAAAGTLSLLPQTLGSSNMTTATFAAGTSAGDATPGTWFTGVYGTIAGTTGNGSDVSVQLAAWYNDGGTITSLAQAKQDGVPWGVSAIANAVSGGPNPSGPASTATALPSALIGNFDVATVPEPSTIALGVMGASAFLMRLRRKS